MLSPEALHTEIQHIYQIGEDLQITMYKRKDSYKVSMIQGLFFQHFRGNGKHSIWNFTLLQQNPSNVFKT